jgi:hypothetical protein
MFICAAAVVGSDGRFVVTQWNTYLIFLAILTFSTVGNIWGNRILGRWNDFARKQHSCSMNIHLMLTVQSPGLSWAS